MEVALFITCLTDTFYPRVGAAVVRVLRHFGCRVHFPPRQTCCGQPAFNSGFHTEAAALLRRMCSVFERYELVVTPSASCTTMLKHHGPALLSGDRAAQREARRLAEKTWEFCTFLRDKLAVDIASHLKIDEPVTFHYPCHAREVYSLADLQGWLSSSAVRVPERADLCCGFGGVFAVEYPELSGAMLQDKLDELVATGAELVISNEAACTLQMAGGAHRRGLPLRFKHLAECLAESLGLMEPQP
ncbi:MAG: (Fe-S)-binding protein [Phycisphaerae bacterium]|nr:(Fe-S)-binding protein [Phycisphaerae bacterium]